MNKKLEWYLIILLVVILVSLSSCSPKQYADKQAPHETTEELNDKITKEMDAMDKEQAMKDSSGPTNFEAIADALGCMFAPDDCPLKKRQEEQKLDR